MKVLICDPVSETAINKMKEAGNDVDVKSDVTPEELLEIIPDYEAIVVRSRTKVRKPLLEKAKNLKLIVRGGVGLDNIDVDDAKSMGIEVRNTPTASSASVAELAVGHMFALARHIPRGTASLKSGEWLKKKLKGTELAGKTLGIIGIGRIGKETAKKGVALGMNVIAYDPYVKEPGIEGVSLVNLDDLLSKSDFVSLHLPHNDETHHLISTEQFSKMKESVYFVNCARGGVADEDALYEALSSGKIAGAAFDVFETEPPADNKLLKLDNFFCTPHIGASTKEGQGRVGNEIAKIINEFRA
ncbi:MAG: 3-phosphoglycerate dehydrogenase [Candidatus Cloacimonadota bacterium]|nr:MAG: 3-phosphoglycerate dehydrogenase [Candidatus Cloacimonadota bacterium]